MMELSASSCFYYKEFSRKDFHINKNHHFYELILSEHKKPLTEHMKAHNKWR
jgi:hypothetical protein